MVVGANLDLHPRACLHLRNSAEPAYHLRLTVAQLEILIQEVALHHVKRLFLLTSRRPRSGASPINPLESPARSVPSARGLLVFP